MKKNKLLLAISALLLSSGLLLGSASETNPKPDNEGGVFICEDTGEEGPMFYAADYSTDITNEPNYSTQNSYTFSTMGFKNAPQEFRGDSVKVAVIDSGLNYTHEDFVDSNGNQIIQGNSRTIDNTSGDFLYYQFSSGYQSKIVDSLGHGTNVASVIASQINALGCAGIAPNVELYIYKVTNTNNGYEWNAINSALSYCISEGIDVINMSFQAYEHDVTYNGSTMGASTGCSSVMTTYINNCYNAGITLVAAAGNYNTSEPSYPASYNHVISVGSLAESSTYLKAGYSNTYGIDLVAPGTVYVADKGTNSAYRKNSGTSFSAPIVTAAIALYKQQNPSATPAQIESALYASCDAISGSPAWAGNGRLNIDKFLGVESVGPTNIVVNNPEVIDDELELEVGDTFDLDWTVNGVGTFDKSVTFSTYSGTNNVVSVSSSGKITAIGEGEDMVGITSNENDSVSAWISVTVKASSTPSGPDPATDTTKYSLINSPDDLEAGYSYIITNGISGTVKAFSTETNSNNRKTSSVTVSNDVITRGSSVMSLTLGGSTGAWTFLTENYASTQGYLKNADSGTSNYLQVSNTVRTFTISFSSNTAVITATSGSARNVIRYNSNNDIFSCYSSGNQSAIYLWKQTTDTPTPSPTLSSIAIETVPTKTIYTAGEYFNPNGLVITRTYSDSTSDTYTYANHTTDFTFNPSTSTALTTSDVSVTISYSGKSCNQAITVNAAPVTSISAVPNKTFYVGETITKSDITVTDNNGNYITDFTFADYKFTYTDASSGGALTNKVFTDGVTYNTLSCSLTAQVQRKAYSSIVPTISWNKITNVSSLSAGDVIIITSESKGKVLGSFTGSNKYANEGTATFSNNTATNITGALEFTLETGSTSGTWKFKNGTNYLYGTSTKTTMCLSSTSVNLTISISSGNATIGFGSSCRIIHNSGSTRFSNYTSAVSNTMLLPQIYKKNEVNSDNPQNVANYIMYEDTSNQCTTKFSVAKGYFENMTKEGRGTFMISDDYVISTARERLLAWAAHEGKTISASGEDYIISKNPVINALKTVIENNGTVLIVVGSIIGLSAVGGYFFIRRRKDHYIK